MKTEEVRSTIIISRGAVVDILNKRHPNTKVDDLHWRCSCGVVDEYVQGFVLSGYHDPYKWLEEMNEDTELFCTGEPGEEVAHNEYSDEYEASHGIFLATEILGSLIEVMTYDSDENASLLEQEIAEITYDGLWSYDHHTWDNDAVIFHFDVKVPV